MDELMRTDCIGLTQTSVDACMHAMNDERPDAGDQRENTEVRTRARR